MYECKGRQQLKATVEILRDSILVISIDEELGAHTATATLGILANLQVLQEPVVNELGLHCRGRERERERKRSEGERERRRGGGQKRRR